MQQRQKQDGRILRNVGYLCSYYQVSLNVTECQQLPHLGHSQPVIREDEEQVVALMDHATKKPTHPEKQDDPKPKSTFIL